MATVLESLRKSSINIENISKTLTETKKSTSTVNDSVENISRIIATNTRVKRELFTRSNVLSSRREEASKRQELEDQIESTKVSTSPQAGLSFVSRSEKGPLDRLLGFLGFMTAGWILENLPTWIFMGQEFISRINSFGRSMYNMVNNMQFIIKSFGQTLGYSLDAIVRLDFDQFAGEGTVAKSFEELNLAVQDLGTNITDTFKLFTTPLTESLETGEQAPALDEKQPDTMFPGIPQEPGVGSESGYGTKEQQALLKAIRFAEGTAGPTGYSMFFGDRTGQAKYGDLTKLSANEVEKLVDKFLKDPQSKFRGGRSAAVGAFQIIDITSKARALGMDMNRKFDQSFQDEMALRLAARRGVTADVLKREGLSDAVIKKLSPEWASFPGNTYGQPTKRSEDLKSVYRSSLSSSVRTPSSPTITGQTQTSGLTGYKVTRSGRTITSLNQLPPHHGSSRTTYGGNRLRQDFTLYKGNQFLNVPVPSPVSGTVNFAGSAGAGGNWVEIQSSQGLVELGHFNSLKVKTGDKVSVGSILGLQGYSGRVSPSGVDGTHVHIQAPDAVVANYISMLSSGKMVSSPIERKEAQISAQPKQSQPSAMIPERKGSQILLIDDTKPQVSQVSYSSQQQLSVTPTISEFKMLNNFIKNKLLLDLAYL
jgi:muramidase (phage lysozyme)